MTLIKLAIVQMVGARLVGVAVTVVGVAVLGRLLDPADFGNFAIAFSVFSLLKILSNFGLRQYIIRAESEIDQETIASATGLSLLIACFGCLVCIGAQLMPRELITQPIATALIPLGFALLVGPLTLHVEAHLYRGLAFGLPARAAVLSSLSEVVAGVAFGWAGFGVAALAFGTLAGQVALAVLLLTGAAAPRPRLSFRGFSKLGMFGGRLTTINMLQSSADLLLIPTLGVLAGPVATGLYNRAQVLRNLLDRTLLDGIDPVVLPAMSGALRRGQSPITVLALKLDYLTVICWPAFSMIAIFADPLVRVLLGAQWGAAVPAVRILALGGLTLPVIKMSVKFFTAIDALGVYLRIQAWQQALRLVLGIAGATVSLEAFCWAMSAAVGFKAAWILLWLRRRFGSAERHHHAAFARGAFVTAATLAAPMLLLLINLGPVSLLALVGLTAACGWLIGLWLVGHPALQDLQTFRRGLRRRKVVAGE